MTRKIWAVITALVLGFALALPAAAQSSTTSAAKSTQSTPAASEKLDINAASKEQLQALPGIGDAYSDKIIANRPYRTKRDLARRRSFRKPPTKRSKSKSLLIRAPRRRERSSREALCSSHSRTVRRSGQSCPASSLSIA
jgi:competence protein ComEA